MKERRKEWRSHKRKGTKESNRREGREERNKGELEIKGVKNYREE